jgi:hypothetical protein
VYSKRAKIVRSFSEPQRAGGAFDPIRIVDEMLAGDTTHVAIGVAVDGPSVSVMDTFNSFGNTRPASGVSGVPAAILTRPQTVAITINGSSKMGWLNGDTAHNTLVVMHELAHAYDFMPGAGGSVAEFDWFDQSWEAALLKDCMSAY